MRCINTQGSVYFQEVNQWCYLALFSSAHNQWKASWFPWVRSYPLFIRCVTWTDHRAPSLQFIRVSKFHRLLWPNMGLTWDWSLMEVVIRTHSARTPIIVNCQLGKRRSTIAGVCDFPSEIESAIHEMWITRADNCEACPKLAASEPKCPYPNNTTSKYAAYAVGHISNYYVGTFRFCYCITTTIV